MVRISDVCDTFSLSNRPGHLSRLIPHAQLPLTAVFLATSRGTLVHSHHSQEQPSRDIHILFLGQTRRTLERIAERNRSLLMQ
jgi:hypothetical protein